jgi:transcriptional regulator with XRE-family HTH domain
MAQTADEFANGLGYRVVSNVRRLIEANEFSQAMTAGLAAMGESTLQKLLNNPGTANPELGTLENLAAALGARDVVWLLLKVDDLETRIIKEGLVPFEKRSFPRRPGVNRGKAVSGRISSGATPARVSAARRT